MPYIILALVATIIGAVVGIGGGLIMRPMLGIMGVARIWLRSHPPSLSFSWRYPT
jgi:uncharacterized membrane protein YfcA